ncbi:MAG: D-2-hydroxyacid dehydrogenase [Chloroflexi bacterium]|nr:D-2-hydroxyacid dehydrogenase [Chloroflexota bacterium]MDA1004267.1 D-2-hydroxyacid dehydrogenase [Chloroflexota bacterium]
MKILFVPNINITRLDESVLARIHEAGGPDTEVMVADSPGAAMEVIGEAEVILGQPSPELVSRAAALKWMQLAAAGADVYFSDLLRDKDFTLTSDKGLVGPQLAEQAFALLLALNRRLGQALVDGPRSWGRRFEYREATFELTGLTMGIVGFGGTGREIARLAAGFGMHCISVDAEAVGPTAEVATVWGVDRLDELLQTSDVVASGLPLTPATRGLFGARTFALMKPTALLINVTRGELVDADALVEAMHTGAIAGAGLDVVPEEPLPPSHALWTTPNVLMTPHIAGGSQFRAERLLDRFCRNVAHLRAGEQLEGVIDRTKGY